MNEKFTAELLDKIDKGIDLIESIEKTSTQIKKTFLKIKEEKDFEAYNVSLKLLKIDFKTDLLLLKVGAMHLRKKLSGKQIIGNNH